MKSYKSGHRKGRGWFKFVFVSIVLLAILVMGGYALITNYYRDNLLPVDTQSTKDINFSLRAGMTTPYIAQGLKDKELIRSTRAFTQYVRSNELGEKFIAGTYKLNQSMTAQEIVEILTEGRVAKDLFTIYPGNNLDQIKKLFADNTQYSQAQVEAALQPDQYSGHPALVDLPEGATLEGFLYPDSYQFIAETKPEDIVRQSLDEMAVALSPEVRAGIASQGLSVYQGIILSSIVEREVGERGSDGQPNDNRAKAAQVFIKRLNDGIKLESNATDGYPDEYDTYTIAGLPPAPISNVSASSLKAVASPSQTSYLFFVSGTDCVTRFSETNDQHEALKSQHGIAKPEDNCRG